MDDGRLWCGGLFPGQGDILIEEILGVVLGKQRCDAGRNEALSMMVISVG